MSRARSLISRLNGQGTTPFGIVTRPGGGLYGFTAFGGNNGDPCGSGCGTLFSLTPPASPGGAWTENTIYGFTGGSDGFFPNSLILAGGVLYGTVDTQNGFGQVFSLTPPEKRGGTWRYTVLYTPPDPGNTALPLDLLMGADGVLYGTIETGVYGGVFSLTPPASPAGAWTYAAVYAFAGGSDANSPNGLTAGSLSGDHPILYGTSDQGGAGSCHLGCGTIFSLTPPASPGGAWTEAVLYSFMGAHDGEQPGSGVAIGSWLGLTRGVLRPYSRPGIAGRRGCVRSRSRPSRWVAPTGGQDLAVSAHTGLGGGAVQADRWRGHLDADEWEHRRVVLSVAGGYHHG